MWPTVEFDENGIFIETHVNEFVTVNLALYAAEERKRLVGKEKKPLLVLFNRMVGIEPEYQRSYRYDPGQQQRTRLLRKLRDRGRKGNQESYGRPLKDYALPDPGESV